MNPRPLTVYESAQLENFEKSVLSGSISPKDIMLMLERNELSEAQLNIVNELASSVGMSQQAQPAQPQQQQPVARTNQPQQNNIDPQKLNQFKAHQTKQWQEIKKAVNQSQLFPRLDAFQKLFPQDKYVVDATTYVKTVLNELHQHLSQKYPHVVGQQQAQPAPAPQQNA